MSRLNKYIEAIECTQSWQAYVDRNAEGLNQSWSPRIWACLLSCYDFLGRTRDLASLLRKTPTEWYSDDPELFAIFNYADGRLHQARGFYARAMAAYMRAATLAATRRMRMLPALQAGTIERMIGNIPLAERHLLASLKRAVAAKDYYSAAHVQDYLVGISILKHDIPGARERLKEARAFASLNKNGYRLTWLSFSEGELEVASGRSKLGVQKMLEAVSIFRAVGARNSCMHTLVRLSDNLLTLGDLQTAKALMDEATAVSAPFQYNTARMRLLVCYARLAEMNNDVIGAAKLRERAELLRIRVDRELGHHSGVLSFEDVKRYLRTLSPQLFEILCGKILELNGLSWELTSQNQIYFDLVAQEQIGTGGARFRWAVSCKRWFNKNVGPIEIPAKDDIALAGCGGMMLMTTRVLTREALLKVEHLRASGVQVVTWTGEKIINFLISNEEVLAEVAHHHITPTDI